MRVWSLQQGSWFLSGPRSVGLHVGAGGHMVLSFPMALYSVCAMQRMELKDLHGTECNSDCESFKVCDIGGGLYRL